MKKQISKSITEISEIKPIDDEDKISAVEDSDIEIHKTEIDIVDGSTDSISD